MPLTLSSNIDAVMARFTKLEAALPVAAHAALSAAAVEGEAIATRTIEAHTPVGDEPQTFNLATMQHEASSDPGKHLQDTTEGTALVSGATATIIVRQTKTVDIQGEPFPLAALLTSGHKAAKIKPVNKQALFWPGAEHPVGRVMSKAAEPNPYIAEATVEILPLVDAALAVAGKDALTAALAAT